MIPLLISILSSLALASSPLQPQATTPNRPDSALLASFDRLQARADSGDAKAIFDLSNVLERGYGPILPDSAKSISLLRRAASDGYSPALNYYGFKYYNGDGVPSDKAKGLQLIEQAALKGDPKGAANLGWLLAEGNGVYRDIPKAVYWLEKASDAGLPVAMVHLASIYSNGADSIKPDTLKAADLYSRALQEGYRAADLPLQRLMQPYWSQLPADSALSLGIHYFTQGNAPRCGVALFRVAAEKGSPRAYALLGEAYALGRGVPYDYRSSTLSFYRSAKDGYPPAAYILAEMLDIFPDALTDILDSPEDADQNANVNAAYWYQIAAQGGITSARQALEAIVGPNAARLLER